MTRKDYQAMAEVLRNTYKVAELGKETALIEQLVKDIAKVYAEENERFNLNRFLDAVYA